MNEVSFILRNRIYISIEEFRMINNYSIDEHLCLLIERNKFYHSYYRTVEYIFDEQSFLLFYLMSKNILAYWDSYHTRYLGPNDEYPITEFLSVKPF